MIPNSSNEFRAAMLTQPQAVQQLRLAAERALAIRRLSVVDKTHLPTSLDPHDYVSFGPYWWPDPEKPDGLPYIRRDGQVNPTSQGDRHYLESLCSAVSTLILKSHVEPARATIRKISQLLREWFIESDTRMNPHLRYAQAIPGLCEGRGIGLIDTWGFCFLLESVRHLEFNEDWSKDSLADIQTWFSSYLDWLLESPEGKQECAEHNNHGTWYDAQIVCYAMFCGRKEIAERHIEQCTLPRIEKHFQKDGSQPHELTRTLSLTYCGFNLLGFACIARESKTLGYDLWNWTASGGGQISRALRWLRPYYQNLEPWPWPQIEPFHRFRAAYLMALAATETGDPEFSETSRHLTESPWEPHTVWPLFGS